MDDKDGFIVEEVDTTKKERTKHDNEFFYASNTKCLYCDSSFLDAEICKTFNLICCRDCRYTKVRFITKTTAFKNYLVNNNDLSHLNFISRPNPHKGNWHDMCLYLEDEVEHISIVKFGDKETIEKIRKEREEIVKNRKIKKLKHNIRDLKRRTFLAPKKISKSHKHVFIGSTTIKKCLECGLKVEQEIL